MEQLSYKEKIAVLRILQDIILADKRVDHREAMLYEEIAASLQLDSTSRSEVADMNSLIALTIIDDFTDGQKTELAKMMGRMIVVDEDINYNEVRIYNAVNRFCNIKADFQMEDYPEYSHS